MRILNPVFSLFYHGFNRKLHNDYLFMCYKIDHGMNKRSWNNNSMLNSITFLLLIMLALTLTNLFHFGIGTENDLFILKIIAKPNVDNIVTTPYFIIEEVNLANLEKTVRDLSSFHTRHTESEYLDDVAYWLTEKLQSVCDREGYVQDFTYTPDNTTGDDSDNDSNVNSNGHSSYDLKNIICEKPGSTNNTIIIAAHYDSRMEDIKNSTARAPGADDNASGVSALLEVARILSNVSLNHSIIFALFSGEEQGKLGSTYYADYIDKADVDLDLLINLDMIGFSSDETYEFLVEYDNGNVVQDNDKHSQAVANLIKGVAEKYTNLNATLGFLGNSDYIPFEALGYTVIGLHDDGVTKNPDHHTTADTPDALNYEYLTSTTKLVLATILSLDKLITTESPGYAASPINLKDR
jgi:Peptidase family M28